MPLTKTYLQVALCLLSLCFVGCGGPLSHTVKLSRVPAAERQFDAHRQKIQSAQAAYDDSKSAVKHMTRKIKEAKHTLKLKKHDLRIAEEQLDVEKAKDSGGQPANIAGTKTRIKSAKTEVEVATATLELRRTERDYLEQLEDQQRANWILALAQYESAKAAKVTGADPRWRSKKEKIGEQLRDEQEQFEKEKKRSAKQKKRVKKSEDRLVDAKE